MNRALGLTALLTLAACSGTDDKDPDTGTDPTGTCGTELFFEDANNYAFTASFELGTVEITPETPFTVDWSALSVDIRGRTLDPTTVQEMLFVEFELEPAAVLEKIDANTLDQSDALNQYLWENDGVSTMSADLFVQGGNPMNYSYVDDNPGETWLLSATNTIDGRFDFLMNVFVKPTTGSTNTTVSLDNSTSVLNFDVDLQTLEPLCVPADEPAIILDWTKLEKDAYKRDLDLAYVNNLVIGHLPYDVAGVEGVFLRLYEEADALYDLDVNALDFAYLDEAVSREDGSAFPGFTADGTWVVAIECVRPECTNPAPLMLTILDVQ